MAGMFDDLMSYLMGGTQMGNFLGVTSPTASTQAPAIVPSGTAPTGVPGPILGGAPAPAPAGGLLSGLLGGQQPVNPMSYFQPRPGLLGDSPLGNMLRGGFAGLGAGAGSGGLTGMGNAFMGGGQAIQDRRKQEMAGALAGQEYQKGQATAAASNLQIAEALRHYNILNRSMTPPGQTPPPDLTYADVINDPQKLAQIMTASIPAIGQSQAGGQGGGAAAPVAAGTTQGQQAAAPAVALPDIANAIHMQESGGATGGPPSDVGATGGWQIMPDTFKSYAKPGEDINNPKDNAAVAQRIIADLAMKGGNDPGSIAVGYVSGPGNMAPPGSAVPWIHDWPVDPQHPEGLHVSGYVNSIRARVGLPPIDTGGAVAQGQVGGGQQGGGQAISADQANVLNEIFKQSHHGYTQAEWRQYGAALGGTEGDAMIADANKSDPAFIGGQKAAEVQGTQGVTYGGPQAKHDRAIQLADDFKTNKTVIRWGVAKPAADAFQAGYESRGQPGGSSDYALVEAALQVLNPDVTVAKPGTAEYATQLQTLPGQVADAIQKAFSTNSALDQKVVDQLKQAVDQRMAINKKLIDKTNASFDDRAKTDAPGVKRSYWNPEGFGFEEDQSGSQGAGGGSQTTGGQTQTPAKTPAKPQWTQDHPATLGAGATDQAKIAWFKTLPIGSVYKDPDNPNGPLLTKNKEIGG